MEAEKLTAQDPTGRLPAGSRWLTPEMEDRLLELHLRDRLPFVIGVTGHRDPDPASLREVEAKLRGQLRQWRKKMPNTPFLVLSQLADGADRFVARLALEPEVGAKLVAPLPLPKKLYEQDFSEESLEEFREILKQHKGIFFELPAMPGVSESEIDHYGPKRDEQYALGGAFIAKHCHVLVALWDAEPGKTGGTADVVGYKLEGIPEVFEPVLGRDRDNFPGDALDLGPVYHFPISRLNGRSIAPESRILYPRSHEYESADDAFRFFEERLFGPLEAFNEGVPISERSGMLLAADEHERVLVPELRGSLSYLERLYGRADRTAVKFAGNTRTTLLVLSLLAALSAACFDLAHDLSRFPAMHHYVSPIMLGFPFFVLAAYITHSVAVRRRFQDRHQDVRALAEGLRVQFFWQVSGLSDSVASCYLGQQRSELYWIRRACAAARVFLPPGMRKLSIEQAEVVRSAWVEDQHRYYSKKAHSEHKRLEVFEAGKKIYFILGMVIITLLSLCGFESLQEHLPEAVRPFVHRLGDHNSVLHVSLMLIAVMSAVIAGLIHNYTEKNAISYHARQYGRMERLFRQSRDRLDQLIESNSFDAAQQEIRSLGLAALAENAEWVRTHRERPLEVPHH